MPASRTEGRDAAPPRRHRAGRTPRAARTLVAVLGVGSIALTAAAADPAATGDLGWPGDVFAAGEGGLGRLDDVLVPVDPVDDPSVLAATREGERTSGGDDDVVLSELDEGVLDGPVDVLQLGEESLASFISGGLADNGVPAPTLRAYRAAAEVLGREQPDCRIDWALLAGIGRVESNHGRFGGATVTGEGVSIPSILGPRLDGSLPGTMVIRDSDGGALDGDTAYDRAVGPMQFLPGTWKRWGSDGDRDGTSDPQNINDAALASARYLCSGTPGLDQPGPAAAAVRRYNNSSAYVDQVLGLAEAYRTGGAPGLDDGLGGGGYVDPFGDSSDDPWGGGYGPLTPYTPAPPGWQLPPGVRPGGPTTPSAPSPTSSPTASPTPSSSPTSTPTSSPSTRPTSSPSPSTTSTRPTPSSTTGAPTAPPSGTPTSPPPSSPTGSPTSTTTSPPPSTATPTPTVTSPPPTTTTTPPTTPPPSSEPTPTCTPTPEATEPSTEPSVDPSAPPTLAPCPPPCGGPTAVPTTEPSVSPSPTPSCLPAEPVEP